MNILRTAIFLALAIPSSAFAINKCTDTNGKLTFTDAACPQDQTWTNPPPPPKPEPEKAPTPSQSVQSVLSSITSATPQGKEPESQVEKDTAEELLLIVRSSLKDPESAKFRDIKIAIKPYDVTGTKTAYAICGEVNAKNSYGGYTGFEGFVVENNIHGKPTFYMQNNEILSIIWQASAKQIGCL